MPHHNTTALSGIIKHVFAHRFTLEAEGQTHLADLGPKGAQAFPLLSGLAVSLEGERRPSEIKVTRIETAGREPVQIEHKKPNHAPGHQHADARPTQTSFLRRRERQAGNPKVSRIASPNTSRCWRARDKALGANSISTSLAPSTR